MSFSSIRTVRLSVRLKAFFVAARSKQASRGQV
jgi:hypothetical protein